jgi:hypothetical protein
VWEDDRWTTYGIDSGWTRAHASAGPGWWAPKPWKVSVAADGTVWLPTEADVRQFDGRRWTIHALEDMGFPVPEWGEEGIVHQIALVRGGDQVWVGECQYSGPGPVSHPGVRWFDGHSWQGADSPLGQTCVSVVDTDRAGNVWMGAQNGVWRYEPGRQKWTAYALPESLRSGYNFTYTRDLMTDNSGDIWVYMQCCAGASCDANTILFRIHDGKWSKVFERLEWFLPLQQLALDGKGQGWLFWGGSVYQLLEEEVPAVAEMPARGMAVSPDGKIWVAAGHESDAALWISEP